MNNQKLCGYIALYICHVPLVTAMYYGNYFLNTTVIDTVSSHKDLGILFDNNLRFHGHSTEITTKANRVLGMIKKSFEYLDPGILTKLFTTLVRPILEYNNPIWGPHFMLDQRRVEKIQRRATRLLPHLQDKSYSERLSALSLPSLSYRRHRGDLILLYKIINNYFNSDFTDLFTYSTSSTRGHQFKLFKPHTRLLCRSNYFFNRLINDWNRLPSAVVNANSINHFKSLLDNYLFDSRTIFV